VKEDSEEFQRRVERRAQRLQKKPKRSLWRGLGVIGMIGWSVVLPTLLGLAVGQWLDRVAPSRFSWSLSLLVGGLIFGCAAAWRWVDEEWSQVGQDQEVDGGD
jgi:ATP synthase protein I